MTTVYLVAINASGAFLLTGFVGTHPVSAFETKHLNS
jgi:hypothetical protein